MKKRFFSIALILAMSITMVFGCSNKGTADPDPTEEDGKTEASGQADVFLVGVSALETAMDPCVKIGNANMQVMYNVFETLFVEDENADDGVAPGLALSYEQTDEVTWDLTLR